MRLKCSAVANSRFLLLFPDWEGARGTIAFNGTPGSGTWTITDRTNVAFFVDETEDLHHPVRIL